jgi:hypothetical protein
MQQAPGHEVRGQGELLKMSETMKALTDFLDRIRREGATEVDSIQRGRQKGDVPFIVIDGGRKLVSAAEIVTEFEKTQPAPYRRSGTYKAADLASLISWMHNNTGDTAPVFGVGVEKLNGEWRTPRLAMIGIGNYSKGDEPNWHDFNVRFDFPISYPWSVWAKSHSEEDKPNWMKQEDFAEFIENRIHDLSSPARGETLSEAVTRFLEASGKKEAATPAEMFKISRDLKIFSSEKIETRIDLQSGEAVLQYTEEHTGPGGRPLKIPAMFYIRVPVFFGQAPVLIGVKLRYRNAGGGSVAWCYSMFAPDLVVADEFEKACAVVRKTNRPVYLGAPDKITS